MPEDKIFSKDELAILLEHLNNKGLLNTEPKSQYFGEWDGEEGFVVLNPKVFSLIRNKFKAIDLSIIRVKFPNKTYLVIREDVSDDIFV